MKKSLGLIAAILGLAVIMQSQPVQASGLTVEQFLKWDDGKKRTFIQTTVLPLRRVAHNNSKKQEACINEWYFKDPNKRATNMIKNMKKGDKKNWHPTLWIMWAAASNCSPFKYK